VVSEYLNPGHPAEKLISRLLLLHGHKQMKKKTFAFLTILSVVFIGCIFCLLGFNHVNKRNFDAIQEGAKLTDVELLLGDPLARPPIKVLIPPTGPRPKNSFRRVWIGSKGFAIVDFDDKSFEVIFKGWYPKEPETLVERILAWFD